MDQLRKLSGSEISQRTMWPLVVVIAPPSFDLAARVGQRDEPVGVQAFFTQAPIKAFDETVLHRFSRVDEMQPHAPLFVPTRQRPTRNSGPLSTTIASGLPRFSSTASSTRRTRTPPKEVSTSIARHSPCSHPPTSALEWSALPPCNRSRNPSTNVDSTVVAIPPPSRFHAPAVCAAVGAPQVLRRGTAGRCICQGPRES